MSEPDAWRAMAAYLYVLGLDDLGIAWECLRRNPAYRDAFAQGASDPAAWGLAAFEDPARDARDAEPLWDCDAAELLIVPAATIDEGPDFDLWQLPAPRRLLHDGQAVRAVVGDRRQTRLRLAPALNQGRPFAYQLRAGPAAAGARRRALERITALERPPPRGAARPADRGALVRMRTFAAFDGAGAGASHRDIATTLFGAAAVADRWSADSEMRAQVRHLVARGRRLVAGGYRSLLTAD